MDAEIYQLISLYLSLFLMFASVTLYTNRHRWTLQRVHRILWIPVVLGLLGVILSVTLYFVEGDKHFNGAFPGWLLLELAAVYLQLDLKREAQAKGLPGTDAQE